MISGGTAPEVARGAAALDNRTTSPHDWFQPVVLYYPLDITSLFFNFIFVVRPEVIIGGLFWMVTIIGTYGDEVYI